MCRQSAPSEYTCKGFYDKKEWYILRLSPLLKGDVLRISLDLGRNIHTTLAHLSKTFDCLPHNLIIAKMNVYELHNS